MDTPHSVKLLNKRAWPVQGSQFTFDKKYINHLSVSRNELGEQTDQNTDD